MQRPIPRAGGISERINDEVQFSSHSILMDSGRTLQEEWDLHVQATEELNNNFTDLKKYIGDRVPIPYQKGTLTYKKGVFQEPVWIGYNSQFMTVSGQLMGVNAGQYDVTFKLSDPSYVWSDGTVGEHTVSWYIKPIPIPYPVQKEPYPEFDGNLKEPVWDNVTDIEVIPVGGSAVKSEAGVHTVYLKPSQNYCWEDNTTIDKPFSWTIKRKKITMPVQVGELVFNGEEQTPVWDENGQDFFVSVFSGSSSGVDSGTYEIWFKPTDNTTWLDGTVTPVKTVWNILPLALNYDITGPNGNVDDIFIIFNGAEQLPEFVGYDPLIMDAYDVSISSDGTINESTELRHRNAGIYTIKFVLKKNVTWSDGSTAPFSLNWSINPMPVKVPYISYDKFEGEPSTELPNIQMYYTGENIGPDIIDYDPVWVDADRYTHTDSESIPHGECREVKGTPMDFTTPKALIKDTEADYDQLNWAGGFDHNYCLNNPSLTKPSCTLEDPESGRKMEVYTDLPGVQLYAGNYLDSSHIGKGDFPYDKRYGVCFESQFFPNAINVPEFAQPIAKAGVKAHSTTIYKFV